MSGRRRMMMAMPEDCLTFDIIAEAGQTVSFNPRTVGDITVDFGDGVIQTIPVNQTVTHTYPAGLWKIRVIGSSCRALYIRGTANIARSNERWHYLGQQFTDGRYMFRDLSNSELNFKTLPSGCCIGGMFYNCPKALLPLEKLPDGITDIGITFYNCQNALLPLKELPSTITVINSAFRSCKSAVSRFTELPPELTNGETAFYDCKNMDLNFTALPETLTSGGSMFQMCRVNISLDRLPPGIATLDSFLNGAGSAGGNINIDLDDLTANAPAGGYTMLTTLRYAFLGCAGVTGSRSAFLAVCPNVTDTTRAFEGTNTTE